MTTWEYVSSHGEFFKYRVDADITQLGSICVTGPGGRAWIVQGSNKYFIVVDAIYSDPYTTVTVYGGGIYTLTSDPITNVSVGYGYSPVGFPQELLNDGWSPLSNEFTYASSTTITTTDDISNVVTAGCKIKWYQSALKYANVISSVWGGGVTTLTLCGDAVLNDTVNSMCFSRSSASGSSLPKLDDLSAPDDNTDLDATTSAHGLLPKLDNNATHFINGQGSWSTPDPSSLSNNVTQVDGKYIATDKIRARGGDGLSLQDDGGNGVLIPDGGGMTFLAAIGDKISLYDNRLGLTNMYGFGIESGTLYFKSSQIYRWYIGANADGGASDVMQLNGNDLWVAGDVSALTFTDRTQAFEGDALAAIKAIKADAKGQIDHATLPEIARKKYRDPIYEEVEVEKEVPVLDEEGIPVLDEHDDPVTETITVIESRSDRYEERDGRSLGAMISILTTAVQQLTVEKEAMETRIRDLENLLKR